MNLAAGKYPGGTRFPSEYELAERFGVHKITANKAVSLLVNEHLLKRGSRGFRHLCSPYGNLSPRAYCVHCLSEKYVCRDDP